MIRHENNLVGQKGINLNEVVEKIIKNKEQFSSLKDGWTLLENFTGTDHDLERIANPLSQISSIYQQMFDFLKQLTLNEHFTFPFSREMMKSEHYTLFLSLGIVEHDLNNIASLVQMKSDMLNYKLRL